MSLQKNLYQRGEVWHYRFKLNGKLYRGSCRTGDYRQAKEFYDRERASVWRQTVVGDKVRRTWQETVARWLSEHEHKRSWKDDERNALWWSEQFKLHKAVFLDEITPDLVKEIRDAEVGRKHLRSKNVERFVSPSTVNRKLALLRSVINAAHREYLWLDSRPIFKGFKEDNERVRYLEPHEFARLVQSLPEPYCNMATFAVSTGLRRNNVAGLQWEFVNMARRTATFPDLVMKNGKPLTIPLNEMAMGAVRRQLGRSDVWVFPRSDGERVQDIPSKMWKKALEQAGIENFRWHDLRHTWASWLRQSGSVGLDLIQELGGWKQRSMVQRYSHLSVEHLAQSAGVLDSILKPPAVVAQIGHTG
jgi:integrase